MNINQFNLELRELVQRAIKDGVGKGKFSLPLVIATLNEHARKLEIIQRTIENEAATRKICEKN
jgi:hypothetical protein